ncbi:MAG: hypothetical protein JWO53_1110 [Chlamydiia bacterium]|nr:hypothetical protein [Chlamydiia bacterium]
MVFVVSIHTKNAILTVGIVAATAFATAPLSVMIARWVGYTIQKTPLGIATMISGLAHLVLFRTELLSSFLAYKNNEKWPRLIERQIVIISLAAPITIAAYASMTLAIPNQAALLAVAPGCVIGTLVRRIASVVMGAIVNHALNSSSSKAKY